METTDRWGSTRYAEVFYVGRATFRMISAVVGDGVPSLREAPSSPTAPFGSRPVQQTTANHTSADPKVNRQRLRLRPQLLVPAIAFAAGALTTTALRDHRGGMRFLNHAPLPSSASQLSNPSPAGILPKLGSPPAEVAPPAAAAAESGARPSSTSDVALTHDLLAPVVTETETDTSTADTSSDDPSSLLLEVEPNPEAVAPARGSSARVTGTLRPTAAPPARRTRRRASIDKASAPPAPAAGSWVDPWAE